MTAPPKPIADAINTYLETRNAHRGARITEREMQRRAIALAEACVAQWCRPVEAPEP